MVAKAKVESEGINLLVEPEEFEGLVSDQIYQWIPDAIPTPWWLLERDYFHCEGRFEWPEVFCFNGGGCPYPLLDVVSDLQGRLFGYVDEREITEELVEDFWLEWRYRFLNLVCKAASHEK